MPLSDPLDNWTVPKVLETCIDITDVFIFIDYLVLRSSGILTLSPKVYGSNSVQSPLGNTLILLRRQSDCLRDLTKSKLDGKDAEIKKLLNLNVSKTSISKILEVDRSTLQNYVDKRQL